MINLSDHRRVARALRTRRRRLGLTQDELAASLGLSSRHLGQLELAHHLPRLPTMIRWARELGMDAVLLTPGEGVLAPGMRAVPEGGP